MNPIRRILVVSRMTQYCREAVEQGISLATQYQGELFVLHVVHNPFGYEGWNLPIVSLEKDYQKLLVETRAALDQMVEAARAKGLSATVLISEGDPTKEVLAAVKAHQIDLMILLAHDEGRIEHLFFNRSNNDLIRHLPCSVMLVKKEPQPVNGWA